MTRIVQERNDLLTSFDLRAHFFRVDEEFTTDYHGHTRIFFEVQCSRSNQDPNTNSEEIVSFSFDCEMMSM